MALNFETLQKLEQKVQEAEATIRHLREENERLAAELARARPAEAPATDGEPIPAASVRALVDQRNRIRHSVDRMLGLLDRIERPH